MSKARAIIVSVTVEGISQSEAARHFGVSRSWVSKLMARYRTAGDAAFEPRSRRPHTSPTRVSDVVNDQIVNLREQLVADGLDAGPHTIQWHLGNEHDIDVSVSTIRRRLLDAGLITPAPRKRPKSSYIGLKQRYRTKPGNPTSPTSGSPTVLTLKRSPGSMTTPDTRCMCRVIAG